MGYITKDNAGLFCNTNGALLKNAPEALVLEFPGLGGGSCLGGVMDFSVYDNGYTKRFAEKDILIAYLFTGPWSWGSRAAVNIADSVVDALLEKYGVRDVPVVVCGGSMGGQSALIYCAESRYKITACAAACPGYDVPRMCRETPEFARTVISAVAGYGMPVEPALESVSPLHRINDMPVIPYHIVCDGADEIFDADGMREYAEKLKKHNGGGVEFVYLEGLRHGEFTPRAREELHVFIEENCLK